MSTPLPLNPSLHQLKIRAKELQKEFLTGHSSAITRVISVLPIKAIIGQLSLTDAQCVIAREYGFQSWPKLKKHIEIKSSAGIRGALFTQALCYEQDEKWEDAQNFYRQALHTEEDQGAAYLGLIRVLAKANPGKSFVEIYRDEIPILEKAYHLGVRHPHAVLALTVINWEFLGNIEKGVRLVEQFFREETDIEQVRVMLLGVTDELYSQEPPEHAHILRVHRTFQEESPIALTRWFDSSPLFQTVQDDQVFQKVFTSFVE